MGRVYRAFDEGTERTVALKVLTNASARARELFRAEYQTLAKLAHPRVIRVFEHGASASGDLYYTMELLGGRDLLVAAPLSTRDTCVILRDVCTSLALLHAQQLLHRDVNPRNVRVDEEGRAKLLDFGALAPFGSAAEIVGTPSCLAPEALRGKPLDARTDLFSLGVVAYWALARRLPYPFERLDEAEASWAKPPPPLASYLCDVPSALDELILALLSIDPLARPASAAEVIDRLGAIAGLDDGPLWSIAESHVTSATLVGRQRELSTLTELVGLAQSGHGTLLTLVAERGGGKTRMLRELTVHGQLAGFRTVALSCREHTAAEPFLARLVQELRKTAPAQVRASELYHSPALATLRGEAPVDGLHGDEFEHERVVRLQLAAVRLVTEVARQLPLLLSIDDVDAPSEQAASVLPMLAQASLDRTLLVAVARDAGPASHAVEQLQVLGVSLALTTLDEQAVETLVREMFGAAQHGTRLSRWLMLAARGNPGQLHAVLMHLVNRRIVRYAGGSWLIPPDLEPHELHGVAGGLARSELAALSEAERTLLCLLASHRDALAEGICEALSARAPEVLSQLEQKRLVTRAPEGVRLTHPAIGSGLLASLGSARRAELHGQLAEALLAHHGREIAALRRTAVADLTVAELVLGIATGRHLLRAGRQREALPLLRNGAIELTMRGEGLTDAAPALEDAVELYRRQSRGHFAHGGMMTALALAGTYTDWRLSFRYGTEMLDGLSSIAGTTLARRLAPWMGARAALYLSLTIGMVLFALIPSRRVAHSFRQVLLGLIGLGTGTVSVCTVLQDGARARVLLSNLAPLRAFPRHHPAQQVYEYQCALVEHANGLYAEARTRSAGVLVYLRSAVAERALPATARAQLEAGVLILLGMLDACRTDALALETLGEIERQQSSTSRQTYTATRMAYHGHRGERKACVEWREQTDRLAARGGATWRNDVQVPRMLWSTHAMCGDLLTLKRDMEQLQGLAAEVATLGRLRDLLHACYLCERGMPEEALAQYEPLLRAALDEPGLRALQQLGAYARILRKAGRAADAVAVCEASLSRVTPEEAQYTVLLFALQLELPLALSALGEHARARTRVDALLAAQQGHDNPMLHGLAHGARAEVALAEQDWELFDVQLEAMRRWLRVTQHPTLFAQSQRLLERARAARSPTSAGGLPSVPARVPSESQLEPDFETA